MSRTAWNVCEHTDCWLLKTISFQVLSVFPGLIKLFPTQATDRLEGLRVKWGAKVLDPKQKIIWESGRGAEVWVPNDGSPGVFGSQKERRKGRAGSKRGWVPGLKKSEETYLTLRCQDGCYLISGRFFISVIISSPFFLKYNITHPIPPLPSSMGSQSHHRQHCL